MRAAYLTQYDATNVRYWSGTGFNMAQCLTQAGLDIQYVGPLKNQRDPINIARYMLNKYVRRKNDQPQRDPGFLRSYGREASEKLRAIDFDLVFAPGGLPLSYLSTDKPVVLWTDCTFANMLDYYPAWSNLSRRTIRNGHDAERRALANCHLIIFSSQWAADSAINDYGVSAEKTLVVPFGGNMPGEPSRDVLDAMIAERIKGLSRKLTLFCSGVDWYRKGMDVASAVADRLNASGLPTELLIAGCSPPRGQLLPDHVQLLGFISKADKAGAARLDSLYRSAHWFLCPTRADCTPMVLSEAASYGLPVVARNTGGVGSLVDDGLTGWLCAPDASPDTWAERIAQIVRNPQAYREMCLAAYGEYVNRLSWAAAGTKIKAVLENLLARVPLPGA